MTNVDIISTKPKMCACMWSEWTKSFDLIRSKLEDNKIASVLYELTLYSKTILYLLGIRCNLRYESEQIYIPKINIMQRLGLSIFKGIDPGLVKELELQMESYPPTKFSLKEVKLEEEDKRRTLIKDALQELENVETFSKIDYTSIIIREVIDGILHELFELDMLIRQDICGDS